MRHNDITKPIGLKEACDAIEHICSMAHVYKKCGMRPNHSIVQLDSGSGRTTLLEYMTDMFKQSQVLDFSSGLDDYLEISFDGTLTQLKQAFSVIDSAAVYTNKYSNIIGMDISEIACHLGETQFTEFMNRCKEVCDYACVVFFVRSVPTRNEEKMIEKLLETIDNVERLTITPYNTDDLCALISKVIKDHGVTVQNECEFLENLSEIVSEQHITSVRTAISLSERIVCHADFSGFVPMVNEKTLLVMNSELREVFERRDVK